MKKQTEAERIHADRFRGGTPRSDAYKEGFLVGIRKELEDCTAGAPPYRWGMAQCDAWCSGVDHGRQHVEFLRIQGEFAS